MSRTFNSSISHVTYAQRWSQWTRIRDFREGEDQVKHQGDLYLPIPSGMDQKTTDGKAEYSNYKERASFYAVLDRTIEGITGVAFSADPTYQIPKKMDDAGILTAMTIDGEPATTLAQLIVDEVISVGRFGLLVDLPVDEAPDNRSYVSKYYAEDIRDWRRELVHGQRIYTMIMLEDGKEKVQDKDATRFLRLVLENPGEDNAKYVVETWVFLDDDLKKSDVDLMGNESNMIGRRVPHVREEPLDFIPFIFVNPKTLQPEIEKPPMLDLVNENKSHYHNAADYEHCLYAGAHDTFYIIGDFDTEKGEEKPREIGGGIIWFLPEGTEVGTLTSSGASMDALMEALVHKEGRMQALGARLIHQQDNSNSETATATRLNTRENASVLMRVVDNCEKAMQRALEYMAILMDLPTKNIKVSLNRDFIEARLTWAEAKTMMEVWQSGGIDEGSYFKKAQQGGIIPTDMTLDEFMEFVKAKKAETDKAAAKEMAAMAAANGDTDDGEKSEETD